MSGQQDFTQCPGEAFIDVMNVQLSGVDDMTNQGISVRMHTRTWKSDQDVAGLACASIDKIRFIDDADREAGQIIFTGCVEPGKLAVSPPTSEPGLPAALDDSLDYLQRNLLFKVSAGEVVQEEEWAGAGRQVVVDAHRDKIDSDGVVNSGHERQFQFGADPVRSGNQQRAFHSKHVGGDGGGKSADTGNNFGSDGGFDHPSDCGGEFIPGIDIDPGLFVRQFLHCHRVFTAASLRPEE